jgi:hypothetical protein
MELQRVLSDVRTLSSRRAERDVEIKSLESQLVETKSQVTAAMSNHSREIATLSAAHKKELTGLRREHTQRVNEMIEAARQVERAETCDRAAGLRTELYAARAAIARHDDDIAALTATLTAAHNKELTGVRREHAQRAYETIEAERAAERSDVCDRAAGIRSELYTVRAALRQQAAAVVAAAQSAAGELRAAEVEFKRKATAATKRHDAAINEIKRQAALELSQSTSTLRDQNLQLTVQMASARFACDDAMAKHAAMQVKWEQEMKPEVEAAAAVQLRFAGFEAREAKVVEIEQEQHLLRIKLGKLETALESHRLNDERRAELSGHRTANQKLGAAQTELQKANDEVTALRNELVTLKSTVAAAPRDCEGRRADAARKTYSATLYHLKSDGTRCDPYVLECMRRLCEECKITFEAAATANAIILQMHLRCEKLNKNSLLQSNFVADTYIRLGVLDNHLVKRAREDLPVHTAWAIGADGGNKGREIDMIMFSAWDEKLGKAVAIPGAAADLHSDQAAKHLADTLKKAATASGFNLAGCMQVMTDGASACSGEKGEAQLFLNAARVAAAADAGAPVHRSLKETCAIHGKALEEKHAMEAAFPGEVLCNFTRLVWECFSRKCGYADFYRAIWVDKCGLPGSVYDTCLGMLPEPTESKWQVMHEVSCSLRLKFKPRTAAPLPPSASLHALLAASACRLEVVCSHHL